MYRLFTAIDFPPEITEEISSLCHSVRGAKWVPSHQLHLTLVFAGSADTALYYSISAALEEIHFKSFELTLSGTGYFSTGKRPRVLWVGITGSPQLSELAANIHKALISAGTVPEKRKFSPHITVARLRDNTRPEDIIPFLSGAGLFRAGPVTVSEFHLYSSILRPDGAEHGIEATYQAS